ncbi:MAG: HlyD family efflux transporter periplasmic adaptor subunit [Puniceicoccales bacterium]|jgi:HlyD family secretion protein|nr:HlyD family efflux transporter periplasmic adaptor subunit [Puniceicoccales bacterium]
MMRFFKKLSALSLLFCATFITAPGAEQSVGCQGRVLPRSRILRLAAPADQGVPVIAKILVEEGDAVEKDGLIAVLLAETPARLLKEQAAAKIENAKAEKLAIEAAGAQSDAEIALQMLNAQNTLAEAEATLITLKAQSARMRLSVEGVREIEAALTAHTTALERMRTDRPVFEKKLTAAVHSAQVQVNETSGSRKIIAIAAREEAAAAKDAALHEYDARVATAGGEATVLKAKLAAARALNALPEREAAEAIAANQHLVLARARLAALEDYRVRTRARYRADAAVAQAAVADANAALQLATARLAMTGIRAPAAGRVLRILARPGEAVGPGGVAEVADLSQMIVEAEVSVADLARVKSGAVAEVFLPGMDKGFSGKIVRIGLRVTAGALVDENPAVFKDFRIVPVEIELDNPAALSGYTGAQVNVRIAQN